MIETIAEFVIGLGLDAAKDYLPGKIEEKI